MNFPVISNYTARPYKQEDIKRNLIEQITNSVKWTESIRYLMGQGVTVFEEIGPGNILTKLIQTIQRDEEPLTISAPEDSLFFPEGNTDNSESGKEHSLLAENIESGAASPVSRLGDQSFKEDYGLTYAYLAGAMHRGSLPLKC